MFVTNSSSWSVAEKPWDNVAKPPTKIRRWVFKFAIDPMFQYEAVYRMLRDIGGIKKLAHINANNAMGKAMRASVQVSYKTAGFDVVVQEEYGPDDTNMTAQLTKIKAVDFNAMIISGSEVAGGITYKQTRDLGIKQPILGLPPLVLGQVLDAVGKSLDGLRAPAYAVEVGQALPLDDPQRAVNIEMAKLVLAATQKKADSSNAWGWDGISIFADALKRANPDLSNLTKARSQIRDAMETIRGLVACACAGDMTKWHDIPVPMVPCELRGGKLTVIGKKISPTWKDFE